MNNGNDVAKLIGEMEYTRVLVEQSSFQRARLRLNSIAIKGQEL